jgi:DNA-binding Lrp family transcriptional regulator
MKAIILLKITSGEVRGAYHCLKRLERVSECCMTFGRYDAAAIINADSLEEIRNIIISDIQPIPGVTETLTSLVVEDAFLDDPERQKDFLKVSS